MPDPGPKRKTLAPARQTPWAKRRSERRQETGARRGVAKTGIGGRCGDAGARQIKASSQRKNACRINHRRGRRASYGRIGLRGRPPSDASPAPKAGSRLRQWLRRLRSVCGCPSSSPSADCVRAARPMLSSSADWFLSTGSESSNWVRGSTRRRRSPWIGPAQSTLRQQVTIVLNKPVGYVSGQPEPGFKPAVTLILPESQYRGPGSPAFKPSHL